MHVRYRNTARVAGFLRRCQNSLRQTSPEMMHFKAWLLWYAALMIWANFRSQYIFALLQDVFQSSLSTEKIRKGLEGPFWKVLSSPCSNTFRRLWLSQPGGGTLSPPSSTCHPRFSDLATALRTVILAKLSKRSSSLAGSATWTWLSRNLNKRQLH